MNDDDRAKHKFTFNVARLTFEFKGIKIEVSNLLSLAMGVYIASSAMLTRVFDASPFLKIILSLGFALGTGSFFKTMFASWVSATLRKKERAPSLILSDWYARDVQSGAFSANLILVACLVVSLMRGDYVAASIVGAVSLGIFCFGFLTKLRATRGWFADNGFEALELLNFVISKHEKGGLPPGMRVSHPASAEAIEAGTDTTEQIAGVRA
jgi:hypothetical protein